MSEHNSKCAHATTQSVLQFAAEHLPDGFLLEVIIERESGTSALFGPAGEELASGDATDQAIKEHIAEARELAELQTTFDALKAKHKQEK